MTLPAGAGLPGGRAVWIRGPFAGGQDRRRRSTSNTEHRTLNTESRNLDIQHPTPNIQHPTNLEPRTSNFEPRTSNLELRTSKSLAKPPNATSKPPQSVLIANRLRPQSHPKAPPKLHQSSTKAT